MVKGEFRFGGGGGKGEEGREVKGGKELRIGCWTSPADNKKISKEHAIWLKSHHSHVSSSGREIWPSKSYLYSLTNYSSQSYA